MGFADGKEAGRNTVMICASWSPATVFIKDQAKEGAYREWFDRLLSVFGEKVVTKKPRRDTGEALGVNQYRTYLVVFGCVSRMYVRQNAEPTSCCWFQKNPRM